MSDHDDGQELEELAALERAAMDNGRVPPSSPTDGTPHERLEDRVAREVTLTLRALEDLDMRLTAIQAELLVAGLALVLIALAAWKGSRAP